MSSSLLLVSIGVFLLGFTSAQYLNHDRFQRGQVSACIQIWSQLYDGSETEDGIRKSCMELYK